MKPNFRKAVRNNKRSGRMFAQTFSTPSANSRALHLEQLQQQCQTLGIDWKSIECFPGALATALELAIKTKLDQSLKALPLKTEIQVVATGRIYVKTTEYGCLSEWQEKQRSVDVLLISDRKARTFKTFRFVDPTLENHSDRFSD